MEQKSTLHLSFTVKRDIPVKMVLFLSHFVISLRKLCQSWLIKRAKYYAEYYSKVVNKSNELLPLLKEHEALLLAISVCERIMTESQSISKQPAPSVPRINNRYKQCLQYISINSTTA